MTIEELEPRDPNDWVRPVAIGVSLLLISWNVTGWLLGKGWTLEGVFLAAMTGGFQLLSLNASAQMRRAAAKHDCDAARRFWTTCLFMCSGWAAYSAHYAFAVIVATEVEMAWSLEAVLTILHGAPALVVLTAAAFLEPFLPWAIESVEAAPRKSSQHRLGAVATGKLESAQRASRHASRSVASALSRQAPRSASKGTTPSSQQRVAHRAPPLSEEALRQVISEMTQEGEVVSMRKIAKRLNVPVSRVERSPGRHLLAA